MYFSIVVVQFWVFYLPERPLLQALIKYYLYFSLSRQPIFRMLGYCLLCVSGWVAVSLSESMFNACKALNIGILVIGYSKRRALQVKWFIWVAEDLLVASSLVQRQFTLYAHHIRVCYGNLWWFFPPFSAPYTFFRVFLPDYSSEKNSFFVSWFDLLYLCQSLIP